MDLTGDVGWVDVPMLDTVRQVICRASNRIFVGLPKCREQDWINLNIEFTLDVTKCRIVLNFFPPFLKPCAPPVFARTLADAGRLSLAGRMLTTVPAKLKRAMYHLEPIIEGRRQKMMESGKDYADKPNDMLQWFLEDERGMRSSVKDLSLRMLAINFAAVHTSSNVRAFSGMLRHTNFL